MSVYFPDIGELEFCEEHQDFNCTEYHRNCTVECCPWDDTIRTRDQRERICQAGCRIL